MKCFTKWSSQNRDKCTHGGHSWINLDQQSIIRLSHVWNYHVKGMILKPVGKLIVKCNSKCVLFLKGSYYNIPSVLKKKKKKCKSAFCGPRVPPPNPTTHHSHPLNFTHISSLFWPALSFLSFIFSLFILLKHTHSPASLHSKTHHLTIIFPTRSLEKYLGTPKHLHHFIWGKSSNLFLMGIMFLFEVILPKL